MSSIRRTSISSWNEIFKKLGNDDNPKTTDTSNTDKYETSHTNWDDYIENVKDMKNTNDDDKYKEDTS